MTDPASSQVMKSDQQFRPREFRLDFFRGVALIFIFLDHIPANVMNWLTIRNFGFSDASEAFVFIAGYSAVLAYGRRLDVNGFVFVMTRIYKRCWQLYVAQLLLFMVFTAQVAYTAATFNNPMYSEEMGIANFLSEPHVTLLEAMLLKFRPTNMDILPLYIVILLTFPFILVGLRQFPKLVLLLSGLSYLAANCFDWNLPTWPDGTWLFNPLAWQLIFVLGVAAGLAHGRPWIRRFQKLIIPFAALYLLFAFCVVATWHFPALEIYLPDRLQELIYPIDKTNLSLLRLVHFLALAYLVILMVPADSRFLRWAVSQPIIHCGQHPLEIFCLSIFLSFAGHILLVELSDTLVAQVAVSLLGISVMIGAAYYLNWYRKLEKTATTSRGIDVQKK